MSMIKRIIFMPIKVALWLVYVIGDCILRLLCNAIGIIIPILVICIVYLVINQIWTSVVILLGSILIAFIILVLFSKLIFAVRNII